MIPGSSSAESRGMRWLIFSSYIAGREEGEDCCVGETLTTTLNGVPSLRAHCQGGLLTGRYYDRRISRARHNSVNLQNELNFPGNLGV